MIYRIYNSANLKPDLKSKIVDFFLVHTKENETTKENIEESLSYILKEKPGFLGGFVLITFDGEEIIGAVIVHCTNIEGYTSEFSIIYPAVHKNFENSQIKEMLLNKVISFTEGNVSIKFEPGDSSKYLQDRHGFESKYFEMYNRFVKQ